MLVRERMRELLVEVRVRGVRDSIVLWEVGVFRKVR